LRVSNTGRFKVTVPIRARDHQVAAFIDKNTSWIDRQQKYFQKIYSILPNMRIETGADFLYLGQFLKITADPAITRADQIYLPDKNIKKYLKIRLKDHLEQRLSYYCAKYDFVYNQLKVKDINSNWGSCSGSNNLNFNYHLVFVEAKLIDYLLVHELVHLRYKHHGKRYWQEVAKIMPDYKNRQLRLRSISQLIFCWGQKLTEYEEINKTAATYAFQ